MQHNRCTWCGDDPLYTHYHDHEWGVPVWDDCQMFEHLILESFQSGLSWITILKKRENFRQAFAEFNPEKMARFNEQDVQRLLQDEGIIRNRKKIDAAINNARAFLEIQEKTSGFANMLWQFVDGTPVQNSWPSLSHIPAQTDTSQKIHKHLKNNGFVFLGPTTCYAHMQATGMVNDHVTSCFRYKELKNIA